MIPHTKAGGLVDQSLYFPASFGRCSVFAVMVIPSYLSQEAMPCLQSCFRLSLNHTAGQFRFDGWQAAEQEEIGR